MAVSTVRPLRFAKSVATRVSVDRESQEKHKRDSLLLEERDVVEQVLCGKKDEFGILVERYQNRALAVAIGLVGNRADAQDLVQHAFLKAYSNLKSFRGQSSFYTWFYRILFNLSIDLSRKAYRRSEFQVDEDMSLEAVSARAGGDPQTYMGHVVSPGEALERSEMREAFTSALEELTPEHRSVLMLREIDGLSYSEISDVVGCTKGTVMSRLHHARKKMQGSLKKLLSLEGNVYGQQVEQ